MTIDECIALAKEFGFTAACALDPAGIELREEVRAMCAEGVCGAYDHNWTCPPACGTLDECRARVAKYQRGIIVQTTGELEDAMDYESMQDIGKRHNEQFRAMTARVRELFPDALALGAGGCRICKTCSYPDEPCRHPDQAVSSMEGYGMLVSEVCRDNDIPYHYGTNTLTYVGCYLLD